MASRPEPLTPKDGNVLLKSKPEQDSRGFDAGKVEKAASLSMDVYQQWSPSKYVKGFEQKKVDKQNDTYVSPSDNIMSPASVKLSALKEKRLSKLSKPKNLFGQTASGNAEFGAARGHVRVESKLREGSSA